MSVTNVFENDNWSTENVESLNKRKKIGNKMDGEKVKVSGKIPDFWTIVDNWFDNKVTEWGPKLSESKWTE